MANVHPCREVVRPKFERKRLRLAWSPRRFIEADPFPPTHCWFCGSPVRLTSEIAPEVEGVGWWCKCPLGGDVLRVLRALQDRLQAWHPDWQRWEVEVQAALLMNEGDWRTASRPVAEWELINAGLACPVHPPLLVGPPEAVP